MSTPAALHDPPVATRKCTRRKLMAAGGSISILAAGSLPSAFSICSAVAASLLTLFSESAQAQKAAPPNLPALKVVVDLDKVDLEGRRLEVTMSREAERVVLKVFDASGQLIDESEKDFQGKRAGVPLILGWRQPRDAAVARIDVYAYDAYGYYKAVRIVPWSLSIPHEDVKFTTNSATLIADEVPKLEASFRLIDQAVKKHQELGQITLFIAGHTDTQGSAAHNLQLSRKRARAIAGWFRRRGLKGPIAYEGFGEHSPRVRTKDNVDEPKNRRVDYLLGLSPPRVKVRGMTPSWKAL